MADGHNDGEEERRHDLEAGVEPVDDGITPEVFDQVQVKTPPGIDPLTAAALKNRGSGP